MAVKRYDFKLRRNQYDESRVDVFTRHIDLDDPEQGSTVDGLLVKLMIDAIKRAGGKVRDLGEYDLQVMKHGERYVEFTFVAHVSEVPEELLR